MLKSKLPLFRLIDRGDRYRTIKLIMLNVCVAINLSFKCNCEFYINSQNDNNIETMQHLLFSCRTQKFFSKYLSQQTTE